jgi:hypothetical protein
MSLKYSEVIDHEATIRTLRLLNDSLDRPLQERILALGEIDILKQRYVRMDKNNEKFDAERAVDRRLISVRMLTQKIVEHDQQKDERGSKKNRKPSEFSQTLFLRKTCQPISRLFLL